MNMKVLALFIIVYFGIFLIPELNAQSGAVKGMVRNSDGQLMSFVNVAIEETKFGCISDQDGSYFIDNIPAGTYQIQVSFIGFEIERKTIEIAAGQTQIIDFVLHGGSVDMDQVVVSGKSAAREIRETAFNVAAIDVKSLYNTSQNINQLLNKVTGVKIREDGGLGSDFSFSLNGFSGKQVKFFLDGVPMDNFGPSLTLNNFPVNLAKRIEVYKGVVPIELGSDALGGAVNIVTDDQSLKFLDFSYQLGSFNTHRLALTGRWQDKGTGLILSTNGFFNYSDNNYRVKVQVPDPHTGKHGPPEFVRRFHDGYQSYMGQMEVGFAGKDWADLFLFGLLYSANKKEIQNGLNMDIVTGQVFNSGTALIPTFKFKKQNILTPGLNLIVNANLSFLTTMVTDTSSRKYDWSGNYVIKTFGSDEGEIAYYKTLFSFKDRNALGSAYLSYTLGNQHDFGFNFTRTYSKRQGEDPLSKYKIAFEQPNFINKSVSGLSYKFTSRQTRFFSTLFAKLFNLRGETIDAAYWEDFQEAISFNQSKPGYGLALNYWLLPELQAKTSFENTWRLPEPEEIFGNGLLLENNPYLRPEKSMNINLGFLWNKPFEKDRLSTELNLIFRNSDDFIRLESDGIISRYSNLSKVRTLGVEWATKYHFLGHYLVGLNATFQDIRNMNRTEDGILSNVFKDRLPNIPFLFGNMDVGYQSEELFTKGDKFTATVGIYYVNQFYLFWPSQGSTSSKFNIPRQINFSTGITYSFAGEKYHLSLDCTNLSNAALYDNFRLQKPGRAFNFKIRYFLN